MNIQEAVYTEKNNCQDCYKCIRHCPVKAIKMENHSASIVHNLCIFCGECVDICPVGAKKIRNDINTANYILSQDKPTILSLAPSYPLDFNNYEKSQFIYALKQLGFSYVSETAIGAEILSENIYTWLKDSKPGVYISSCCPTVVHLIQKYYPEHSDKISPFTSPADVHAKYLREKYGDVNIIFAGPCISKKTEVQFPNNDIDVVLTFKELNEMLQTAGLSSDFIKAHNEENFQPFEATSGRLYPIDGGMLNTMIPDIHNINANYMSFSGIDNIKSLLSNMPSSHSESLFIELMACPGGCINGPGRINKSSIAKSRNEIIKQKDVKEYQNHNINLKHSISMDFNFLPKAKENEYSEKDILESLALTGKLCEKDELNCGGCGYSTCRLFAKALLDGKAEKQMCVSYMRKMAQNKASVLLQKMPYGVVVVDENLRIIESNKFFANLWGNDVTLAFEAKPGLEGANIEKITHLSRLFQNLLESGNDRLEKSIRFKDKTLNISLFTIQKHKQVCAIVQLPGHNQQDQEILNNKLRKVIKENMQTAQKVASLLGENVANAECLINNVLDAYKEGEDNEQDVY